MDGGSALAIDPFAVDGIEGPGAIEGEAAGRGDAGLGDGDRVERFDRVETDVSEMGRRSGERHWESLAEECWREARRGREEWRVAGRARGTESSGAEARFRGDVYVGAEAPAP